MGVLNTEATRDPQKDDNKVKDHLYVKLGLSKKFFIFQLFESIDFDISFLDYRDRANHSHDTHV